MSRTNFKKKQKLTTKTNMMYYSAKFKLCAENAANHSLIGPGTWDWGGEKLGGMEWKHGGNAS